MKKLLSVIIAIVLGLSVQGQTEWSMSYLKPDSGNIMVGISSEFFLGAEGLDNKFLNLSRKNSLITNQDKDRVLSRLQKSNRLGSDLNSSVYFSQSLSSQQGSLGLSWFLSIRDKQHFDARYPKDAFELAFYGNKRFAGDTADLADIETQLIRYQQIQAGLLFNNGTGKTMGLGLALLHGEQYLSIYAKQLDIYTSSSGDLIEVDANVEAYFSDTNNIGWAKTNGWGASIDLLYEQQLGAKNGNGLVRFEVNDLGWINWNSNTLQYNIDTVYSYNGVVINDLFELNDSIFSAASPDSVSEAITQDRSRGTQSFLIPTILQARLEYPHHKHFRISAGLMQRLFANHRLYAYVNESYSINQIWSVSVGGGFGGYRGANLSISSALRLGKTSISMGTYNVEGLIFSSEIAALSGYFSIRSSF